MYRGLQNITKVLLGGSGNFSQKIIDPPPQITDSFNTIPTWLSSQAENLNDHLKRRSI